VFGSVAIPVKTCPKDCPPARRRFRTGVEARDRADRDHLDAVTIELNQGYVNPFVLLLTFAPWLVGAIIRDHRQMNDRLVEVGRQLEAETQRVADEAVRLERANIERELHDIVAHCVSVMVIQAYAGERIARTDHGSATEAFDHIAEAAGQAKLEIAYLVELLAEEPTTMSGRDLAESLENLVAGARTTGLDICLHITGSTVEVSPESAVVAYRVVQESVTNALKHSPCAPITISVDCGADDVAIGRDQHHRTFRKLASCRDGRPDRDPGPRQRNRWHLLRRAG
jgi:signal transduction histidine kinase